jgi:hypothetical protein
MATIELIKKPPPVDPMVKLTLTIFGILVGFSILFGILYFVIFPKDLFGYIAVLGVFITVSFMMNLFFYQGVIKGDDKVTLGAISPQMAAELMKNTLATMGIVVFTLVIVYGFPYFPYIGFKDREIFVKVFENTVGFWVAASPFGAYLSGAKEPLSVVLANIFKSDQFRAKLPDDYPVPSDDNRIPIDISFLLTVLDNNKMADFFNVSLENEELDNIEKTTFGFTTCAKNDDESVKKLAKYVALKNQVGKYMWLNMSGVVALLVAMISSFISV